MVKPLLVMKIIILLNVLVLLQYYTCCVLYNIDTISNEYSLYGTYMYPYVTNNEEKGLSVKNVFFIPPSGHFPHFFPLKIFNRKNKVFGICKKKKKMQKENQV